MKAKKTKYERQFSYAKQQAEKRNIDFSLFLWEYCSLTEKPCYYCACWLSDKGVRLDRIDSKEGYNINNVVPCCGTCNLMKGGLNAKTFYDKIERIYLNLKGQLPIEESDVPGSFPAWYKPVTKNFEG